ncbi:flagellar FlbD family protein [Pseudokineococcus lusitanus]|uniref:Flagellar protein FlbD n=1 Tax=Pseudokineococcus lusitanus TaxID=763993 RepID=A0A3N1HQR3_9ACTN|nr:flagellar FlbD family protein [Pseudokineococcus lusitanus]ROP44831.1 flagellar protein FlbD [Pseudokineococcus lusitanus]
MIILTRLAGSRFAVNPDLLERVESTPDTVLTLLDGTKYVVSEPLDEVVRRVADYRATVIATARRLAEGESGPVALPAAQEPWPADVTPELAPAVPLRRRRRS